MRAGQDSLAAGKVDGSSTEPAAGGAAEEESKQPESPRVEVRSRPGSGGAASGWEGRAESSEPPVVGSGAADGAAAPPATGAMGGSELVGYLDGNRAPLEKPPQA